MKTTLKIKNFRIFDENGVSFEINPITILTGSNSSGKSSAVKAIFLLNSFLSQIKKAVDNGDRIELDKYKLDFTKYPNNLLGRFDKVVNSKSVNKTISISYSIYSLMLSKDVEVNLVFSANENDVLNNAYLDSMTMSTEEGVFYSTSQSDISFCNLNILKEDFATFLLAEYAIHTYCGVQSAYGIEGTITKDEYESNSKMLIDYLGSIEKSRRTDILRYVRFSNTSRALVDKSDYCSVLEKLQDDNCLFSIPLLEALDGLNKDEVKSFIDSHCMDDASDGLKAATRKVLNSYARSESDTFNQFFKDFAQRHLDYAVCLSGPLKTAQNGVRMLDPVQLSLHTDLLGIDSFDIETIAIYKDSIGFVSQNAEEKKAEKMDAIQKWESSELTFELLYEVVMKWNRNYESANDLIDTQDNNQKKPYVYEEPSILNPFGAVYHIAYELLIKLAAGVVHEAIKPEWGGNMSYVSSSRASVNRLYTLDSKDDFSLLLYNYFEKKRIFLDAWTEQDEWFVSCPCNSEYYLDSFMNSWIKKFEIGQSISFDVDKEGLGVQIRLHKTENDEGRLLADEGYGITQLVSILLQIETAILSNEGKKANCYYGMDILDKYDSNKFHYEINTISIEEPEIHLHPKYQSLLADMLVEAYQKYNIHFVVETHSEYLIRKLQLLVSGRVKDIDIDHSMVSIYYINSANDKSKKKVKRIGICSDGYLDDSFGEGFYDEATRLSRQLM